MQWYIAKIVYRIICGEGNHTPQFDEQLRLINAEDHAEAFEKANRVGRRDEETFLNENSQLVKWQFINISELYKLASLSDGLELYSRVQETDHAGRYIEVIHKKAEYLRSSFQNVSTLAV
jgi:hypothetical protein